MTLREIRDVLTCDCERRSISWQEYADGVLDAAIADWHPIDAERARRVVDELTPTAHGGGRATGLPRAADSAAPGLTHDNGDAS